MKTTFVCNIDDIRKFKSIETSDTLRMSYYANNGWDYTVEMWSSREVMVTAIRKGEASSTYPYKKLHKAIIDLKPTEGY